MNFTNPNLFSISSTTALPVPNTPKPIPLGQRVTLIAYCYILPVICVLGIVGNLTNVITLASRRLRAVSYMYLRALALADLLCMIFVLIFVTGEILQYAGHNLNQSILYRFYQAHLMLSMINWALATGVYVVVALSLERFVSIVFPMHFRTWNSPNRAMKAIATAYIIPAVLYLPYAIGRYSLGEKKLPDGSTAYMTVDSEASKTFQWQVYKWTREGLLRFLPLIVLSILNFRIMLAFRKRQQMFARLTNRKEQQTSSSKDDTLLYMLGGIVAMFFICNIPAAINLLFINETVKKRVDYQIFRAVANLLEITNHAAQFYVFCACSTDYRTTFLQKFPCFKANYAGRARSFIRRGGQQSCKTPALSAFSHVPANNSSAVDNGFQLTYSTGACDSGVVRDDVLPKKGPFSIESLSAYAKEEISMIENDEETGDIHLASGEEDIDSDFEFGVIAELTVDANGSTHL
ncbi:hypothetical protein L596_014795 [Steinernema carpocapsae]|uniref:G-protein coupled receptors family 1 profile domain-containing protein n=1 Tax=Steinernema carpocapsae TaxID=34508 RepID=A0A4U5NDU5_STECR|nr:hypothetical protein L596_014795 [Steinernema carpocapsae]